MLEKGLGTGLGALLGAAAYDAENVECVFLPISKVEPAIKQPRRIFNESALNELADSIAEHGIIQPLTVRKLPSGSYQIIAGERRWRAARLAGLTQVPARIIEADDRKAIELALVENLQREDLNPLEEAEGYKALIEDFGLTQEEAAEKAGKSRPAVANALRLLALPEEVKLLLEKSELSTGHARALLALKENEPQLISVAKKVAAEKLSVRQTEELARRLSKQKPLKRKVKAPFVDYIADLERHLTENLGRKIRIVDGKKKGRIEIEYYGNEDLEKILEALEKLKKNK
ncbi:MAG: ParB/RepB/Spo0J family partition protein [Oscillospiraceae bacterium]|nr:ParB/RepB/Spo0J family partition protein [Oscillospiraceae bacterium]